MKILQVGKFYHPYHGGIETIQRALCEGLVQSGDEVTVICSSHPGAKGEDWVNGVRVLRAPTWGNLLSQPLSLKLSLWMKRLSREFDVVHLHSPNPLAEVSTLLLSPDIPLVTTHHSDIIRQRLALKLYRPVLKRVLGRVDRIVVPTEHHIRHSPILPQFESKCVQIPFGLDGRKLAPSPRAMSLAEEYRAKHGPFALFVGRLVPYKGVRYLLEAMASVPSRLVIIGEGPLEQELKQQASALELQDKVHFAGRVEGADEMLAFYEACDLFVLPSIDRSEMFGMVLLEAMSRGKPLVTTRIPSGVRYVNEEGVTGLHVEPCDSKSLADAMRAILGDSELRKRMSEASARRFSSVFTVEKMVSDTRALYSSLT